MLVNLIHLKSPFNRMRLRHEVLARAQAREAPIDRAQEHLLARAIDRVTGKIRDLTGKAILPRTAPTASTTWDNGRWTDRNVAIKCVSSFGTTTEDPQYSQRGLQVWPFARSVFLQAPPVVQTLRSRARRSPSWSYPLRRSMQSKQWTRRSPSRQGQSD